MPYAQRRPAQQNRFTHGPWSGVLSTNDPLDDAPDKLVDATNLYFPDPAGKCGAYARPGFALQTPAPLASGGTFRGQGVFSHVDLDGTITNFCVIKGKLFRTDNTFSTYTDVTPVGITISDLPSARVYGVQFGNQLVVTDGHHKPWIMTDFTATPVTGTSIQLNAADDKWTAHGKPTVYGGSLFFILDTVVTTSYRSTLVWSAPADAATGYQQTDYDYSWTIFATGISPITAIQGTNTSLYYGTQNSIGEIAGPVGPNLQSTATTVSISVNVGMAMPQTVVLFGTTVFFCDVLGRPWMLPVGAKPVPIYLQMRSIIENTVTAGYPLAMLKTATAAFEANFNLYLVAIFPSTSSNDGPATEMYAFDAHTGTYEGRWIIGQGIQIETLGSFVSITGMPSVVCLGSLAPPSGTALAESGYVWVMNGLASTGDYITTENGWFLTTEDGLMLTTEGTPSLWTDNLMVPQISATTCRIGYNTTEILHADRVALIANSQAPVTVTMRSSATAATVEAIPTPLAAQDQVYRATAGADIMGRGMTVLASPTTATEQWALQSVTVDCTMSQAAPDEA